MLPKSGLKRRSPYGKFLIPGQINFMVVCIFRMNTL